MIYNLIVAVVTGIEPQTGIRFDPTIALGSMVHLVVLLVALVGLYYKILAKIEKVKTDLVESQNKVGFKVDLMWKAFQQKFYMGESETK